MSEAYIHLHELLQPSLGSPAAHDEARKDSENKMWSGYMEEADKHDTRVSDAWKDDANGVLVFTGLFSATVATFIIESYKKLSPDSGDKTVYLLGQISKQLTALSSNGTYIPPTPSQTYSPGLSIILVNSLWLLSLVFSIASALVAILIQQWARRYIQLPKIPTIPRDRARVRSYLFLGMTEYHMPRVVDAAPALLHLSVFLFFAGLVIFLFTVFEAVAIVVSICVGLIGFVYLILTILPCLDHSCPYRTPMSSIWWYFWHTSLGLFTFCARWLLKRLHGILVPSNPGVVTSLRQRILNDCIQLLDDSVKKHGRRLKDGFRNTIVQRAIEVSADVDSKALIWLLNEPALADKSKIQEFVASIPGDTIVQLISAPFYSGKLFSQHLSTLLRSCAPGLTGLDGHTRRRRLVVCLNAVHHIARAFRDAPYGDSDLENLLEDVRIKFANAGIMRSLWADEDPAIRVTSRSICALLARRLLHKYPPRESELAWLQDILGETSNTIYNSLENPRTVDNMNIDSFTYGVLSYQTGDLPDEAATSFVDTLAILMGAGSMTALHRGHLEEGFSELLRRAKNKGHPCEIADKLRKISEAIFRSEAPTSSTFRR
ncbi:hypothetical protein EDB85DRAFT_600337 [Lactarius pseudohatsudake]|nr:hypothetical protein EDB85DRAFT_600337 [Lactarius pseudohatsudake]